MSTFKDPNRGTYTPASGGQAVEIDLHFDKEYKQVIEQEGVFVEVTKKAATVKATDVPAPRHGDTLVFGSDTYTVRSIIPSGGLTTLILSE